MPPATAPITSRCGSNTAPNANGPDCGRNTRLTTSSTSASDRDAREQEAHARGEPLGRTWTNSNPNRPFTHRWPS